jgi:hypothetical protein
MYNVLFKSLDKEIPRKFHFSRIQIQRVNGGVWEFMYSGNEKGSWTRSSTEERKHENNIVTQ